MTGTFTIEGLFHNPGNIPRPGMYANIGAATDLVNGALLVPQAAVVETHKQYQIAVVSLGNTVTLQTVALGDSLKIIA